MAKTSHDQREARSATKLIKQATPPSATSSRRSISNPNCLLRGEDGGGGDPPATSCRATPRRCASVTLRCELTGRPRGGVPQVRPGPQQAARGDHAWRRAGPAQGQLVRQPRRAGNGAPLPQDFRESGYRCYSEGESTMSMTDPIADMLVRIKNAAAVGKPTVKMPSSKTKVAIARVLKDEGYIADSASATRRREGRSRDRPEVLRRPSGDRAHAARVALGLRQYRGKDALPKILNGLGIAIISTSKGIMTDAPGPRKQGVGGEVICLVA
jgi:small subunit ribosomal protein S8